MLGNDDTVHPYSLGRANQSAQILRVLKSIEYQNERRLAPPLSCDQDLVYIGVFELGDLGNDPLMAISVGDAIQSPSLEALNGHSLTASSSKDFSQAAGGMRALGYEDPFDIFAGA
jgi:hypothetical protein